MRIFSRLLDGISITVKSPDGKIECELSDGRNLIVGFAPGAYRRYSEQDLARQLESVFTSLWEAHRRARLNVVRELAGCDVREGTQISRRSREYTAAYRVLKAHGRSQSGNIEVSTEGLTRWSVVIKPNTIRQMGEEAFLSDLWSAFLSVMTDHRRRLMSIRRDIILG